MLWNPPMGLRSGSPGSHRSCFCSPWRCWSSSSTSWKTVRCFICWRWAPLASSSTRCCRSRYRLPFFVLLSVSGILLAFGAAGGGWLIAAGLILIGICHLPLRLWLRVSVLLCAGAALALARGGVLPSPVAAAVWPILGSMFMFRLALYLHALKHDKTPPELWRTLAYFFMLPNVAFPLFPVVDYTTFHRTYYDEEAWRIYATGVRWIVRGIVHLVLYRVVYLYVVTDPGQLRDLADLSRYLLGTFLLYLRVSGQFHLIVGMLHLFGFRLPETHHLYFLSSSFTDFWRRINIYWKDFMMKLVYFPSFFRLRKFGPRTALIGATIIVFLSTWMLHSYQWFWLRGGFPLTAEDALFWGILGSLVVVNALHEARRGRQRTLTVVTGWSARRALATVGTFAVICVLWSLWSAESVIGWLWIWPAALQATPVQLAAAVLLLGIALVGAGYSWDRREPKVTAGALGRTPKVTAGSWGRPELQTAATLLLLLAGTQPTVQALAGERGGAALASLQTPALNAYDADLQNRGYYEKLDDVNRLSSQLWDIVARRPAHWVGINETAAHRTSNDFIGGELVPLASITFMDQPLTTNRWGMRDRDYELVKPAGTRRIALLGPSYVMGSGVADGETIDAVLEGRLNADGVGAYEVLNFGIPAFSLVQQAAMLDERVMRFEPDIVMMMSGSRPAITNHLTMLLHDGRPIPYEDLRAILGSKDLLSFRAEGAPMPFATLRRTAAWFGIETRMPYQEAVARVHRAEGELLAWAFRHAAARIRAANATPVYVELNTVTDRVPSKAPIRRLAAEAGFIVLDLRDVFDGHDPASLRVAEWDRHANALGYRIVAERLHAELKARQVLVLGSNR
jgi:D-alanyl-lipoteichoic acid acyltransferase DltB (MBOAT superfamily)